MLTRLRSFSLGSRGSKDGPEARPKSGKKKQQEDDEEKITSTKGKEEIEEKSTESMDDEDIVEDHPSKNKTKSSRSRSRSFGRMFRRGADSRKKQEEEDDDHDSDEEEDEDLDTDEKQQKKKKRGRSLSNPLRMIRGKSFRSKEKEEHSGGAEEDIEHEVDEDESKEKKTKKLGRKRFSFSSSLSSKNKNKEKPEDSLLLGEDEEHDIDDKSEYSKKSGGRGLSKGAKSLIKKLRVTKSFRLNSGNKNKTKKPSPRKKSAQPRSPEQESEFETDDDEENTQTVDVYTMFLEHFTRADLDYFKTIVQQSNTMCEALTELVGEENELLLARLGEMVENEVDLFRVLAVLRSTNPMTRLSLLYDMHDLQGTGNGCSRDDLRAILRFTVNMELVAKEISPQSVQIEEADPQDVNLLRLEKFYLEHAPEKLNRVASILDKYRGKEVTLWKKLEKQYFGVAIPTELDVWPLLSMLSTIDELVEHAFSKCVSKTAKTMPFEAFVKWMTEIDSSLDELEDMKPVQFISWREIATETRQKPQTIEGWLRVTLLDDQARNKRAKGNQPRKVRLSELSWRRRWCITELNKDGTLTMKICKGEFDEDPYLVVDFSEKKTQVDAIERPGHKHRWTIMVNHKIFLQASRASSHTFEDWLFCLRSGTHERIVSRRVEEPHQRRDDNELAPEADNQHEPEYFEENDDDEEEEEEEDGSEYTGSPRSNMSRVSQKLATRIQAFYSLENPDKLGNIKNILEKYRGREEQLIYQLEKQYPGSSVPKYSEARLILQEQQVESLYNVSSSDEGEHSISEREDSPRESDYSNESPRHEYESDETLEEVHREEEDDDYADEEEQDQTEQSMQIEDDEQSSENEEDDYHHNEHDEKEDYYSHDDDYEEEEEEVLGSDDEILDDDDSEDDE